MWHRLFWNWPDGQLGSNETNSAVNKLKWCRVVIFRKGMGLFWFTAEIYFVSLAIVTSELKFQSVSGISFYDALGDVRKFEPFQERMSRKCCRAGTEKLVSGVRRRAEQHKCQFALGFFWLSLFLGGYRKLNDLTRSHFKIKMYLNFLCRQVDKITWPVCF